MLKTHRKSYVTLHRTKVVWSIHRVRGAWTIIERSGRFWMMVQGKEKWKKINKVQHLSECGHDINGETDKVWNDTCDIVTEVTIRYKVSHTFTLSLVSHQTQLVPYSQLTALVEFLNSLLWILSAKS